MNEKKHSMVRPEQMPSFPTTISQVMRQPHFALGVADARHGRPFRPEYERWDAGQQESYERGRAWAIRLTQRDIL
jgi:hypothetical protein